MDAFAYGALYLACERERYIILHLECYLDTGLNDCWKQNYKSRKNISSLGGIHNKEPIKVKALESDLAHKEAQENLL